MTADLKREGEIPDSKGNGSPVEGIITSMCEVRNAEERLLLLEKVIEDVPDGIQIVDLEGRILYSNAAVEGIYGFSPEEFRGRHVNEMNEDPTLSAISWRSWAAPPPLIKAKSGFLFDRRSLKFKGSVSSSTIY